MNPIYKLKNTIAKIIEIIPEDNISFIENLEELKDSIDTSFPPQDDYNPSPNILQKIFDKLYVLLVDNTLIEKSRASTDREFEKYCEEHSCVWQLKAWRIFADLNK